MLNRIEDIVFRVGECNNVVDVNSEHAIFATGPSELHNAGQNVSKREQRHLLTDCDRSGRLRDTRVHSESLVEYQAQLRREE